VFPALGKLPVKDIVPAMVARVIEAIVKRGSRDTAGKVWQHVRGIFRLAAGPWPRNDNPADPVGEVLPAPKPRRPLPALLT